VPTDRSGNEGFLFGGLDTVVAVVGADPDDRLARAMAGQDGKTGQGHSRWPTATEAPDLRPFPAMSPVERGSRSGDDLGRIIGDTEVRPVEVIVGPRWLPPVIQVEAVVRRSVAGIGVRGVERRGGDLGAVGRGDH
jgi:hypothetical protein